MDFGVEICLDHSDVRLRRNIDNEPWPVSSDAIHVQLIPSCGMQISVPSVAADRDGFVFNCDGQYALNTVYGTAQQGNVNGVECIYANYADASNTEYAGHSQLARVQTPATGNDPNGSGSSNASFQTLGRRHLIHSPGNRPIQSKQLLRWRTRRHPHIWTKQPLRALPQRQITHFSFHRIIRYTIQTKSGCSSAW